MHNPETFKQIQNDRQQMQSRESLKSSQFYRHKTPGSQQSFRQTMQDTFNRPLTRQLNKKLKEKNLESTFYQTFQNPDLRNTQESGFYNNQVQMDSYQSFSEFWGSQTPLKKHNILTFGLEGNQQYNKIKTEKLIFNTTKKNKQIKENIIEENYQFNQDYNSKYNKNSKSQKNINRFSNTLDTSAYSLQTSDSLKQSNPLNQTYGQFHKPKTSITTTTGEFKIPPIQSENNKYLTAYVKQPSTHLNSQQIRQLTEEQYQKDQIRQGNINPYAEQRKKLKSQASFSNSKYISQNNMTQNGWYQNTSCAENRKTKSQQKMFNTTQSQFSQKIPQDSTIQTIGEQNMTINNNTIMQLNNINVEQQLFFDQFANTRKMLWVLSDNFETVHSKKGMKYSYFPIPCSERFIRQKKAVKDFQIILKDIQIRLKLQTHKIYAYLKDGTIVNSHLDIPETENIIIVNLTPYYKGIDGLTKNKDNVLNMLRQLEEPLLVLQDLNNQENIAVQNQDSVIEKNSSHQQSKMTSPGATGILRQQSSISENYYQSDFNQTNSIGSGTKLRFFNYRQKKTMENQIAKKFQPEINTIIQLLNQKDPDSEMSNGDIEEQEEDDDDQDDDDEDEELDEKQKQQAIFQRQLSKELLKQKPKDEIQQIKEKLTQNLDMPSEALEKAYYKIIKNRKGDKLNEIIEDVEYEVKQKYKISKKMKITDKQEYLNEDKPLIASKTVNKYQKIIDFYEQEMQDCSFNLTEVEDQPNKITEQILNKKQIQQQQQDSKPSEIQKIADELGIFKKEPIQKKIRLFDNNINEEEQHDKFHPKSQLTSTQRQQQQKELNQKKVSINENISQNTLSKEFLSSQSIKQSALILGQSKTSQHMSKKYIERKKYNMVKQISEMIQEFLHSQKKQIKTLKEQIQEKKKNYVKQQEEILQTSSEEEEGQSQSVSADSYSMEDFDVNEEQNRSVEINFDGEEDEEIKHVKTNKLAITSKKEIIREIHEQNKMLTKKNIPQILIDIPELTQGKSRIGKQVLSNFSRFDVHQIFIIYKALHQVTSQRYKIGDYLIENGMDKEVYRNGLYQIFMQCDELADDIFNTIDFNYSGWMDWGEFLKLMVIIRAKSLAEKINLFIRIADKNGDGKLEKDEIFDLAKACLGKYIKTSDNGVFLNEICEYFTRLIFEVCEVDLNDEIPLKLIRKTVIKGQHPDNTLLCMFCGADI